MNKLILFLLSFVVVSSGCVSKKKYNEQIFIYREVKTAYDKLERELNTCNVENEKKQVRITALEAEIEDLKARNKMFFNQLTDLSIISKTQAESINKSIDNIASKDSYIKNLQNAMARKDSLNMALVMSLKSALKDVNDEDIEIKVDGSAVFVSLSDKMLFEVGKYNLTKQANDILGKIAQVIKANPDIQFMVEGHTDAKPIKTSFIQDNWDLSVLRATSVVRTLQSSFGIDPSRMVAAGKGEYEPIKPNETAQGRASNRRTRIVILPELDQFFKLIEGK
jgi:chemotaxis protein MotB